MIVNWHADYSKWIIFITFFNFLQNASLIIFPYSVQLFNWANFSQDPDWWISYLNHIRKLCKIWFYDYLCCDTGQNDTIGKIELIPSLILSSTTFNSFLQSQWRLPLTLTGVRCEANSGMTIHTLVHSSDTFSCHCILWILACQLSFKSNSHIRHPLLWLYKYQCIFQCNHFNFVQQGIQISTRINSSMYIRTSVFVSFETYPIFNNLELEKFRISLYFLRLNNKFLVWNCLSLLIYTL